MESLKLFAAFILIVGLSACPSTDISQSKFVKQSEICQTYDLSVDETENNLDATVFFRFGGSGGTTLVLNDSGGSTIKMGDDLMELVQNHQGAHYSISKAFIPGLKQFTFTDGDGKSYLNHIYCETFKVYNIPDKIDRNTILELDYQGEAPQTSEEFICAYQDTAMHSDSEFRITEFKDHKIFIPVSVFQTMKNGPVTLQFIRRNSISTQAHGSIPGYLNYEYTGTEFKCVLKGKQAEIVKK